MYKQTTRSSKNFYLRNETLIVDVVTSATIYCGRLNHKYDTRITDSVIYTGPLNMYKEIWLIVIEG